VAISAGLRWDDYGTDANCWLSVANGTRWAFIAPVLCILLFNIVVFVLVMRNIYRMSERMRMRRSPVSLDETHRVRDIIKGVRATMSLFSLLGITWIFGALAIDSAAVVFLYLFAICNTLQGLFIFMFHCLADVKYVSSKSAFPLFLCQCVCRTKFDVCFF
jgi:G protein-coupled receptor 133